MVRLGHFAKSVFGWTSTVTAIDSYADQDRWVKIGRSFDVCNSWMTSEEREEKFFQPHNTELFKEPADETLCFWFDAEMQLKETFKKVPPHSIYPNSCKEEKVPWYLDRSDQEFLPLDKEYFSPFFTGYNQSLFIFSSENNSNETIPTEIVTALASDAKIIETVKVSTLQDAIISLDEVMTVVTDPSVLVFTVQQFSLLSLLIEKIGRKHLTVIPASIQSINNDINKKDINKNNIIINNRINFDINKDDNKKKNNYTLIVGQTDKNDRMIGPARAANIWAPGHQLCIKGESYSGTGLAASYVGGIALQALEKCDQSISCAVDTIRSDAHRVDKDFQLALSISGESK